MFLYFEPCYQCENYSDPGRVAERHIVGEMVAIGRSRLRELESDVLHYMPMTFQEFINPPSCPSYISKSLQLGTH